MKIIADFFKHTLQFKFRAGTSRGVLEEKETFFIVLHTGQPEAGGIGEAGPLKGLSIDDRPDLESVLAEVCNLITERQISVVEEIGELIDLSMCPSVVFALETAYLDWRSGGKRQLFQNLFSSGTKGIPINGLVWMGEPDFMRQQIEEKINDGYDCIKLKIGALDFDLECSLLYEIRKRYDEGRIMLRTDANGAFSKDDAYYKLKELSRFKIHSIEQPVCAGQHDLMAELAENPPVPIALDEELIGVMGEQKKLLLDKIKPQYIILKPTLVGGLNATEEWIKLAGRKNIGWWITSALESNIGLNAIAQFTAEYDVDLCQGLGTGKLYSNNISSPLVINNGYLHYRITDSWDLSLIKTGKKMI